jgi:hypothetical protein
MATFKFFSDKKTLMTFFRRYAGSPLIISAADDKRSQKVN